MNRTPRSHKRRESKQPLEMPSAGSTFKRPKGYFAGTLNAFAGITSSQNISVGNGYTLSWASSTQLRASADGNLLLLNNAANGFGLAQFGVTNAVATLGTAATPHHMQKLLRVADRVVFSFDGDAAGRRAAGRALEVCLEHLADNKTVAFLFLPDDHDPDSYVRAFGAEAFRQVLEHATPLAEFLLAQLRQDIDLTTAEGRARLVHEAKPLVTRIGAPLLRLQVIKMLADVAGFSQGEVEQACGLAAPRRGEARNERRFDEAPPDDGSTGGLALAKAARRAARAAARARVFARSPGRLSRPLGGLVGVLRAG